MYFNLNCCKTISCANFSVSVGENTAYIEKSTKMGFVATACMICGSNSPWIDNELIRQLFLEKEKLHFGRKLNGCVNCSNLFFSNDNFLKKDSQYGFTSAGTPRHRCSTCQKIYSKRHFKNTDPLKKILDAIIADTETGEMVKSTGLSSRLYYFYLDKLASVLSNFSRQNEQNKLNVKNLVMHTQGNKLSLKGKKGLYNLVTVEPSSGYLLLQSINLTQVEVKKEEIYSAIRNTMITDDPSLNLQSLINSHYQQTMQRTHFEELLIGNLKTINKCHQIYPKNLAYVHFQLLKAFTKKADHYAHYISHESSLRSGALMAVAGDLKGNRAEVYYFHPFSDPLKKEKLRGQKIGWWSDRWFSDEFGAYCSITTPKNNRNNLHLSQKNSVCLFNEYLSSKMYKKFNSMSVIENILEVHRALFNYCLTSNGSSQTPASTLGLFDKKLTAQELLDEALQCLLC
jgi:hypothetical protein